MAVRTIFAMAEDCARGERRGWQEFVRDYLPIARRLLEHYFAVLKPDLPNHTAAVFERARAQQNAWFRGLRFSNEREFLMAFRELVFLYGREEARVPVPRISMEQYQQLIEGLSLVEREMLWLYVKGYDAPQIAPMIMNAAATAEAVKSVAQERMAKLLPGSVTEVFGGSVHALIEAAEQARTDACLPWKTFNNIVNGQIAWRERELAEAHVRSCLYCIDRFTSFQEMIRYRKDAVPASEAEIDAVLARLGFGGSGQKGLLARLFSGA
ncbi:MAG TPA: hypothetical protein VNK82_07115 [Terriglobales bacterium]|nr:hypothetical protein [Terriglobales bacterium]